jgi:hypothetical protein
VEQLLCISLFQQGNQTLSKTWLKGCPLDKVGTNGETAVGWASGLGQREFLKNVWLRLAQTRTKVYTLSAAAENGLINSGPYTHRLPTPFFYPTWGIMTVAENLFSISAFVEKYVTNAVPAVVVQASSTSMWNEANEAQNNWTM